LKQEPLEAERIQWSKADKDDLDDSLLSISSENEDLTIDETGKAAEKAIAHGA
jgi:hypothetical protein